MRILWFFYENHYRRKPDAFHHQANNNNNKRYKMKKSVLSIAAVAIFSSVAMSAFIATAAPAPQLTPGPGMQQILQQKQSILKKLGASTPSALGLGAPSSLLGSGSNNPHIQVTCNYSLASFPLPVTYSASYLGFVIYQGTAAPQPPMNTPYTFCHYVGSQTCQFLSNSVGIPGPIDADFHGNIVQATRRCGTF